jgi:hypothetical protein
MRLVLAALKRKTAFAPVLLIAGSYASVASAQNSLTRNPRFSEAAQSQINRHTVVLCDWAWQSVIQVANYQVVWFPTETQNSTSPRQLQSQHGAVYRPDIRQNTMK